MKFLVLLFLPYLLSVNAFGQVISMQEQVKSSNSSDSAIEEYEFHFVNDYNLQSDLSGDTYKLLFMDSCFYSMFKDTVLVNGMLSLNIDKKILPNDYVTLEQDGFFASLTGEIINGKKEGIWKMKQFVNDDYTVVKQMNYSNGMLDGDFYLFDSNGRVMDTLRFVQGTGLYLDYYNYTGKLKVKGYLRQGRRDGRWSFYDGNGELLKVEVYKNGFSLTGF